ncbi:MAG: hypothetical protein U0746_02515 [Gemmataceae bacterium]
MPLLLVVVGGFACLFPLALYFLIVSSLNNRPRPTLVTGTTDLLGLLAGLSGFLIVGGPLALAGIQEGWRRSVARGDLHGMADAITTSNGSWRLVWLAYGTGIVGLAALGWWRRHRTTLVYHIDPALGRSLVAEVCQRCGLELMPAGPAATLQMRDPKSSARAEVELLAATASKHLTLDWHRADRGLRTRIEAGLVTALEEIDPPVNPASLWLLGASTVLFGALILGLAVLILTLVRLHQ